MQRRGDPETLPALLLVAVLPFALPAVVLGIGLAVWLRQPARHALRRRLIVGLLALLGLGALYPLRDAIRDAVPPLPALIRDQQWDALVPSLLPLWIRTLPGAPAVALFFALLLPRRPEEVALAREAQQRATSERQTSRAQQLVRHAPETVRHDIVLGTVINGDLHGWQRGRWLCYPRAELAQHLIAIGATNGGKTKP